MISPINGHENGYQERLRNLSAVTQPAAGRARETTQTTMEWRDCRRLSFRVGLAGPPGWSHMAGPLAGLTWRGPLAGLTWRGLLAGLTWRGPLAGLTWRGLRVVLRCYRNPPAVQNVPRVQALLSAHRHSRTASRRYLPWILQRLPEMAALPLHPFSTRKPERS